MDVTVGGTRYREALDTTDKREALKLEKKRIGELQQGVGTSSKIGDFSRLPFSKAGPTYVERRKGRVAERTTQLDSERLVPLTKFFAERTLRKITANEIAGYQNQRMAAGVSNRTVNMEVGVLRGVLKKARCWALLGQDVKMLPEGITEVGRVLTKEQKQDLFKVAASKPEWEIAYLAAVLAVSTTCRGIELKTLRWRDLDWLERTLRIGRSKTAAGHRTIPLNADAMTALQRLRQRALDLGTAESEHFVFPACENGQIDPTRHQKSWRTAWRALTKKAGLKGFRFHDLRHQAITELAEAGVTDATLMSISGHMSKRMLDHYSHVRTENKRIALDGLQSGLIEGNGSCDVVSDTAYSDSRVTKQVTNPANRPTLDGYVIESNGGRDRTRTCDLLRVKQAL